MMKNTGIAVLIDHPWPKIHKQPNVFHKDILCVIPYMDTCVLTSKITFPKPPLRRARSLIPAEYVIEGNMYNSWQRFWVRCIFLVRRSHLSALN
jgi:hypothetical protein